MVHQRGVDAGVGGDGADRRLVDSVTGEQLSGTAEDAIACVGRPGRSPGTLALSVGGQSGYGVLRRSVAAARHMATTAKPITTMMSRSAIAVRSGYAPTCRNASRA